MSGFEDSAFNQKSAVDLDAAEPVLALPQRPVNKYHLKQMLESLLEKIDSDLVSSERENVGIEELMAEYGEEWFS